MRQQADPVKTINQVIPQTAVKISESFDQPRMSPEYLMLIGKQNELEYGKKMSAQTEYPVWDYTTLREKVLEHNPWFILDDFNRQEFDQLCRYYSGDPAFEQNGLSLNKGLVLYGPIGCGKTAMMRLFSVNTSRPFGVVSTTDIAEQYQKNGTDTIIRYASMNPVFARHHMGFNHLGWCYDDLGDEDVKSNFGNEANVMQAIMKKIHAKRIWAYTSITTNLTGTNIEKYYGARIRSRMREMYNLIQFNKNAPDRRK